MFAELKTPTALQKDFVMRPAMPADLEAIIVLLNEFLGEASPILIGKMD